MATCLWISEDRETLLVDYPSEPILAEAAAKIMNQHGKKILQHLQSSFLKNIAEAGSRGELVARILLLMAKDSLINDWRELYSQCVPVLHLLQALIGKQKVKEFGLQDEKMLAEGYVNYTHFIKLTYTPDEETLRNLYCRCGAGVCKPTQASYDLVIPVAFQDKQIRAIVIQVKFYM